MSFGINEELTFMPVSIAVLIVSDSRTLETDTSGAILADRIQTAGHTLISRTIVRDKVDDIQKIINDYIKNPEIDVVITSGGTGITGRDVTPEAIKPLLDKIIDGFSVMFHHVSFEKIGMSTLQSRAFAGIAKGTFIFCLPGSNGAVKDGWDKIISKQIDIRYRPCNMAELMPRLLEK